MALNIPMPGAPGTGFMQGVDTGSNLWSRIMQPQMERARLEQQQNQFVQNLALQKQAQSRAQALLPYMIQQYQDTHKTAASEAAIKDIYRKIIQGATDDSGTGMPTGAPTPVMTPTVPGMPQQGGAVPGAAPMQPPSPIAGANAMPNAVGGNPISAPNPMAAPAPSTPDISGQEHELRMGNPRLAKLDAIAGLVPGIPKPVQHFQNGMVFTTYPSGRMTVQKVQGMQTPGQMNVSAKEASKIRDQATALINSANLVQQGYDLLDKNTDLTGIGSGLAEKFNLSNNPDLGNFTSVTGKLQAELGKYASQRGGIQAVKWAQSVKPSSWKPEDYNYGMFEGIQRNLAEDYKTLNAQYKAATGEDLPVPLPPMQTKKSRPGSSSNASGGSSGEQKVTKKWKLVNGELV